MRPQDGPATVFFGLARRKVLGWLVTHPGDEFFVRELARQTLLAPTTVARELAQLLKAGLVTRSRSGHQVYFAANEASPVFREVQSLLIKTSAVADVIRRALRPLTARIDAAFIVGAAARGELRGDTPVALLVVGDLEPSQVLEVLSRARAILGRPIAVQTQSTDDERPSNMASIPLLDKKLDTAFQPL